MFLVIMVSGGFMAYKGLLLIVLEEFLLALIKSR